MDLGAYLEAARAFDEGFRGRWEPADDRLRASGISEQRPLDFCTPYGCSKACAEQYVLDYAHCFGLPAAVYLPSGTMAQQAALRVWCERRRSSRVALPDLAHQLRHETDGPRLLHGEEEACWPLVAHAGRLGLATRIGLEDVLVGPDGEPVADNADLVRRAVAVWAAAR